VNELQLLLVITSVNIVYNSFELKLDLRIIKRDNEMVEKFAIYKKWLLSKKIKGYNNLHSLEYIEANNSDYLNILKNTYDTTAILHL